MAKKIRTVEGWRSRLAKEAADAKASLMSSTRRREGGGEAKERLEKILEKVNRVTRMEDPALAKEEKRRAKKRRYQEKYRERHPERVREFERRWRLNNREKLLAATRKWKKQNIEKVRAYRREWQRKNKAKANAYSRASAERKRMAIIELRLREFGGMRRLQSQFDGRRLAIDTLRALQAAGSAQCRANRSRKHSPQADALIRAWDELALRGRRQAAVGFCVVLTDMLGARFRRPTPDVYEVMEQAGKLRDWR